MKLEIQLWACVILWQMWLGLYVVSGQVWMEVASTLCFVLAAGTYIVIDKRRATEIAES